MRFIPYEKLSKKQKCEENKKRRCTWGEIKPVTRVAKKAKAYDRKKNNQLISSTIDDRM